MWPFSSAQEAGPSTPVAAPRTSSRPAPLDWDTTFAEEVKIQEKQMPTYEDIPGCMTLMDQFFRCYAFVPAVRGYYRYGHIQSCSHKWDDYKYCLSLKSEEPEERRRLWIKRVAEGWTKRRMEGSSEDVWEVRKTPLENFPPPWPEDIGTGPEIS